MLLLLKLGLILVVNGTWTTMNQCLSSQGILSEQIIAKGTNSYNQANFQWNLRNPLEPAGYLMISKETDVQAAVQCQIKTGFPIVARGGGHSYEKYSVIDSNHLVLDLSGLNLFQINNKVATVGSGLLLGNVYSKLWNAGKLGIPGGTCPTVGISGHVLGGGYGLTSRKFGLMVDQVIAMRMVDAKGDIVLVDKNNNPDLFFALRGAGLGNYGIVTSFTLQTYDCSAPVLVLTITYDYSNFQDVFKSWQMWVKSNPSHSVTATFYISPAYGVTLNAVVHDSNADSARSTADKILNFFPNHYQQSSPITSMSFIDMVIHFGDSEKAPDLAALINLQRSQISQYYSKAKSQYIERYLEEDAISDLDDAISSAPVDSFVLFDLQGGAISDTPANATAFVHRKTPLFSYQAINYADDIESGEAGEPWLNNVSNLLNALGSGASYPNYIDSALPIENYYGDNLNRLVDIKHKWDPTNIFNNPKGIPQSL